MKIAYLVGSLAVDSLNRKLADALVELAPEGVDLVEISIKDLPLYNRDLESEFPQVALDVKAQIAEADGVVLLTPEHNRSFSAALHNALEWSSRPYGDMSFAGKPVATIGTSPSGIGTAAAQQSLRSYLLFFGAKVMGQPEGYIDATRTGLATDGAVTDKGACDFLATWIGAFADFVKANS